MDDFPRLGPRAQQIAKSPILAALLRLVLRACEREPADRFTDARAMLAELERPPKSTAKLPRRRLPAAVCAVVVVAAIGLGVWVLLPRQVDVSFVTRPFEATIYLDDKMLTGPDGAPYRTPCTVAGLPAGTHRVAFQWEGQPRTEAVEYDLARTRQISH